MLAKSYQTDFTLEHDSKTKIEHYRQALGYRWYGEEDLNRYKEMFETSFFKQIVSYAKRYEKNHLRAIKIAEKISRKDWREKTNQEIVEAFSQWINKSLKAYNYCYDYVILNMILPKEINQILLNNLPNQDKFNYYLGHVLGMDRPVDIHREQKRLGEIALYTKKNGWNKKLNSIIRQYLKEFAYLKMFCFVGNPYTEEEVRQKLNNLVQKSEEEIITEMISPYHQLKKNKEVTKEFLQCLSPEEREKVQILKKYLYCSVWGDQNYHKGPYLIRNLLIEICKRNNLAYNQIYNLTADEIILVLQKGADEKLVNEINARAKGNAFVYSEGEIAIYTGEKMEEYLVKEIAEEEKLNSMTQVKGESAHPGKVKGRVKVLKHQDDIASFQEGWILLASDTNPAHIPAMKKASAIVTNEGGMLSHAAIVSREMKKPCIIGTKCATKVFKDGDVVEVDADKGIVRKIK